MTPNQDKIKCGLIMPISEIDGCTESHWNEVRTILKEALIDTDFLVELVSDSDESGIIQKRIVQNIYENQMVICDVSAKNPNVMFELGMRLAFDKPTIIIKDDQTNYSFDTAPIEHLEYPRNLHYHSIMAFKTKLREKVLATFNASKRDDYTTFLKHFGNIVVANIEEKHVDSNEFILQAISDLRDEIKLLSRPTNIRNSNLNNPIQYRQLNIFDKGIDSRYVPEYEFLIDYVNKNKIDINSLMNIESPEFDKLFDHYLENYIPSNIAIKIRHQDTIKNNMVKALQRLASNVS